jgi:Response regulator containing CheY-like receiver domain and AraC-type DNA-binding domain
MYKVLIIDDETPVRQVIRALGQWKEAGVDQVLEAIEGTSALEVMRKFNPEIVFVDMNMPNMNGVEFLKAAGREFPKTKYIVVSGYEYFEYTKQAICSKALDYLLKPVVEAELNQVLMRAVQELDNERNSLLNQIDQNVTIPLARETIITQLVRSEDKPAVSVEQKRILGITDKSSCFGIVLFNILNLDRVCNDSFNGDMSAAFFAFTNVIDELAAGWSNGFSLKDAKARNGIILSLISEPDDIDVFDRALPEHILDMVNKLESLFGAYFIAGIGKIDKDIGSLNKSYKEAMEILLGVNLLKCSDRVFTKRNIEDKSKRISLMNKKEILIYAFESGRVDYARSIISRYFEEIKQNGYWSKEDLYHTAMEFLLIIEDITEQLGIAGGRNILSQYRSKDPASAFTKLEEFSEFILNIVEQLLGSIKSNLNASEKANLYEIKEYIDRNFSQEIRLSYFSNKYYLSKEYLSKQFKEEFGYGIHEYILKVRMEKAGEMISDNSVKINTVSSYLGYKDNNYFSKAFKAYYGVSPTEYRERR